MHSKHLGIFIPINCKLWKPGKNKSIQALIYLVFIFEFDLQHTKEYFYSLDFGFPIDSCKNRETGTLRKLNRKQFGLFRVTLCSGCRVQGGGALCHVVEEFLPEGEILSGQVGTHHQLGSFKVQLLQF